MTNLTDPALEIADLCDLLNEYRPESGDQYLAEKFVVEPWSAEFFQILFAVTKRISDFPMILQSEKISPKIVNAATSHIASILKAFNRKSMGTSWNQWGQTCVGSADSSPIRMLSAAITANHSYPELSIDERTEIIILVNNLLKMLAEHQLGDRDFIRQSLIDGLEHFRFQLTRLEWFGWGYSVQSLRDVILAYFALERGLDETSNPEAGLVLRHLATGLKQIFKYTKQAKDTAETADWAFKMLKAATQYGASGGGGYIAGLLTHG